MSHSQKYRCKTPCEEKKCKVVKGPCKPNCDYDCCSSGCKTACDCVYVDLCVEKNLLNVCRVPLAAIIEALNEGIPPNQGSIPFSQIMLTYEIMLINKSDKEICNVSIFDTLAGIAFMDNLNGIQPFVSTVSVVKSPAYIQALTDDEIVTKKGLLNDPCNSYLPPCSVSVLVVNIALSAPQNSIAEIRYVRNTVTVEGKVHDSNKYKRIAPIFAKSPIWQSESDVSLLVNIIFPV